MDCALDKKFIEAYQGVAIPNNLLGIFLVGGCGGLCHQLAFHSSRVTIFLDLVIIMVHAICVSDVGVQLMSMCRFTCGGGVIVSIYVSDLCFRGKMSKRKDKERNIPSNALIPNPQLSI